MFALVRFLNEFDEKLYVVAASCIVDFHPTNETDYDKKAIYTTYWEDEENPDNTDTYSSQILLLASKYYWPFSAQETLTFDDLTIGYYLGIHIYEHDLLSNRISALHVGFHISPNLVGLLSDREIYRVPNCSQVENLRSSFGTRESRTKAHGARVHQLFRKRRKNKSSPR